MRSKKLIGSHRYTKKELESMPTISQGHTSNLKVEDYNHNPPVRVWLSRMSIEDGMPYNDAVEVEHCINGCWKLVEQYEG